MKTDTLESLGLTHIEALAYTYLVANPSSTGYRVARGIGKPTANVYRALESLGRKGAVVHDRAATPSFRAVPPDDLLARLERDFLARKSAAARELASLQPDEGDERIYALASVEQVQTRARLMLAASRRLVWIDARGDGLVVLEEAIRDARSRGVRVMVRARGAHEMPAHDDTRAAARPAAPGAANVLKMVTDAREALIAALSQDGDRVRDAMWTRSPSFARAMHDALSAEWFYASVDAGLADGLSVDEVEGAFEACRALRGLV